MCQEYKDSSSFAVWLKTTSDITHIVSTYNRKKQHSTLISKSGWEKLHLDEAGVMDEVLDIIMQAFILEVIAKHGKPAHVLCNKDPFTPRSSIYLAHLFPNSKFLMVNDSWASVHSMITCKVTIAGFDLSSYPDCFIKWNRRSSDTVLHHEDLIGKPGGISLSKIKQSMDQVIKLVDLEALYKWTGHIPGDL
ncbi:hypothetical protein A6R68_07035, partial [Neotoma lepida]